MKAQTNRDLKNDKQDRFIASGQEINANLGIRPSNQSKLSNLVNNSPKSERLAQFQKKADAHFQRQPIQRVITSGGEPISEEQAMKLIQVSTTNPGFEPFGGVSMDIPVFNQEEKELLKEIFHSQESYALEEVLPILPNIIQHKKDAIGDFLRMFQEDLLQNILTHLSTIFKNSISFTEPSEISIVHNEFFKQLVKSFKQFNNTYDPLETGYVNVLLKQNNISNYLDFIEEAVFQKRTYSEALKSQYAQKNSEPKVDLKLLEQQAKVLSLKFPPILNMGEIKTICDRPLMISEKLELGNSQLEKNRIRFHNRVPAFEFADLARTIPRDLKTRPSPPPMKYGKLKNRSLAYEMPPPSLEQLEFIRNDGGSEESIQLLLGVYPKQRESSNTIELNAGHEVSITGIFLNKYLEIKHEGQSYYLDNTLVELLPDPELGSLPQKVGLFGEKDRPTIDHIQQGNLGDCFALAALGSIVNANAGAIIQMIHQTSLDTFTVRFYEKEFVSGSEKESLYRPVWIKIDNKVPFGNDGKPLYAKSQYALWPALIEKAYAIFAGKGNGYGGIGTGGVSNVVFEHLMGVDAKSIIVKNSHQLNDPVDYSKNYSGEALPAIEVIVTALQEGKMVSLGTKQFGGGGAGQSGENEEDGLVATHAYSVLSANKSKGELVIRNPWGHKGRAYPKNGKLFGMFGTIVPKETKEATFKLSPHDFDKYVENVYISGQVIHMN